ncbi:hypothetical protein OCK02_19620 [Rhizobium sp. TRM96647]|uniref:hypothetical protein n=1 Tax=unclassified Rhizobium TaxID=2613769 RepID=UPI0021E9237D|nr:MULTISPECIES: hypothetical protein [unclassified Rhizobium]MCV3738419.1 hypothetical protein [Rhizobium sp. TRM96647]MCV3760106.1 hypothetical protein [Rhizobium sp. TRM96650]
MARKSDEWSALLGSTLSKMALVRGTDSPDAYLPDECFDVIEKLFAVAMEEARAEGYASAIRDTQQARTRAKEGTLRQMIRVIRALPSVRLFA